MTIIAIFLYRISLKNSLRADKGGASDAYRFMADTGIHFKCDFCTNVE